MSVSLRADPSGSLGAVQVNSADALTFDANGIVLGIEHPLKSITATVSANALTLGIPQCNLEFRSSTLSNGAVSRVPVAASTLVVPAGATLGTANAIAARLMLLAINNAGTVEPAVVNLVGGNNLDETALINTTAISASATAANVIYSTTARTNVPFRVVGFADLTQATAGTWFTAPTTIQPVGGQALTAMSSIGYGQTWQPVTRTIGTTYVNTTGKPIMIKAEVISTGTLTGILGITINGVGLGSLASAYGYSNPGYGTGSMIIPPGASYVLSATNLNSYSVYELR